MQLPPTPIVLDALRETVGPPFAVGVGVLLLTRLAFGKSSIPFAAVVAFIAALGVGNYTSSWNPHWWPNNKRVLWIPWLAGAGCLAGILIRNAKWPTFGHTIWAVIIAVAVIRLLPRSYTIGGGEFHHRIPLGLPLFVLLTAAVGFGLMHLSERLPGYLAPFVLACSLMAAGTVVIHAHSKSLLDVATLGGMALFAITAVVSFTKSDVGAVFPGAAFLLTGTLLAGHYETYSDVPTTAFLLPAVAPLLALVGLLPAVQRLRPRWRFLLVLLPVVIVLGIAVGLAMANETLAFGDAGD